MKTQALQQESGARERLVKGLRSLGRFVEDPTRLENVFEISAGLVPMRYRELSARKIRAQSAEVDQAFAQKVLVGPIRLKDFSGYPAGSLGQAYYSFMSQRNLSPDAIPRLDVSTDGGYFMASAYETHDIWHVVTGFDTNVAGELGLQAFYVAQTPCGLSEILLLGGFFNTLLFKPGEFVLRAREIIRGYRMGRNAKHLLGVDWKQLWDVPLSEVRRRLEVVVPR